jgi:hypothetical protein
MQQKPIRLGAAALTLGLVALVAVAQAQSDPSQPTPSTSGTSVWTQSAVTGTVVSVDPQANSVTIRTDAGQTQRFLMADSTWMRASGKDITVSELKVGDHVRIEPTPGAGENEPTRTASRLEVLGAGAGIAMGATSSDRGTTPQRTVSTDRPVLGEPADAGDDRQSMPATAGSTTGRSVSTDRPLLGQDPNRADTAPSAPAPTDAQTPSAPQSPSADADAGAAPVDADEGEDALPATASPLPFVGLMGLLALAAGLAVRATRKQLS